MTARQRYAEELQKKQDRISAWENQGVNAGVLDREYEPTYEEIKVEYMYLE